MSNRNTTQLNNSSHIKDEIDTYLRNRYKKLNTSISFETYKQYDADIFGLFTDTNINEFIENYNIVKQIIPYCYFKDITYLYKQDIKYRNKYIYNLLSDENKILFNQSLQLITKPIIQEQLKESRFKQILNKKKTKRNSTILQSTFNLTNEQLENTEFKLHTFKEIDLKMNNNNQIIYNFLENMLTMILTLMDNKISNIARLNLTEIKTYMVDVNFNIVLYKTYSLDNILLYKVIYTDVNFKQAEIDFKEYLYYICLYFIILFDYSKNDLNQYLKNESEGYASNMGEYSYDNYKKLSDILSEQFQKFLKDNEPNSNLIQDSYKTNNEINNNDNLNSFFIIQRHLPYCFKEDDLEIFNIKDIDIDNLITKNFNFKINNELWFNKFSKLPCKNLEPIIPTSECKFFPNFIKSVVRKSLIEDNIKILDLETDIKNNYLQWYYKPNILGAFKFGIKDIKQCTKNNNINNYNYMSTYTDIKTIFNPIHYTLYYNKLWLQLLCYRTAPNSYLHDILNELDDKQINNNENYYNKYSTMPIQLTHLFPFIFTINILKYKISVPQYKEYYKLDLDVDQYYTIYNIDDYDYIGYLYIPFDIDSRNIRSEDEAHLKYYLFKDKITNKIIISGHRNIIYSFFQKETVQKSIIELNIIGYLNNWNKRYETWNLYPYLAIYTSKYKYYNNLYAIDEKIQPYKTNIYISTLKYEELLLQQPNLNERLYSDEINNNNIKIQLEIPEDEDLINSNIHVYIIPIIPILAHQNIKFVCPKQENYNIKDYQSLIESPQIESQKIGGNKNDYFNKYLKYKLKYKNLLNANSKL